MTNRAIKFDAFNLGGGAGLSVKQVIAVPCRIRGGDIPARSVDRRAGDPASLVASNAKARRELGWNPSRSEIDTILETAWKWARRNG